MSTFENNSHKNRPRLASISQMAKMPDYRAFSEASLRSLVFNSKSRQYSKGTIKPNGMLEAGAIYRLGRKVLINLDAFDDWIDTWGKIENHDLTINQTIREEKL